MARLFVFDILQKTGSVHYASVVSNFSMCIVMSPPIFTSFCVNSIMSRRQLVKSSLSIMW